MATEQTITKGREAEFLAQNPAFQEAFNEVSSELHTDWYNSAANEKDRREVLWQQLKALDAVKGKLLDRIAQGQKAEILKTNEEY